MLKRSFQTGRVFLCKYIHLENLAKMIKVYDDFIFQPKRQNNINVGVYLQKKIKNIIVMENDKIYEMHKICIIIYK